MPPEGFRGSAALLLERTRSMIRSGEITERGLAKLMGYSQPHVHNVLAGVRGVNMGFADDLMAALGIQPAELFAGVESKRTGNYVRVPLCSGTLSSKSSFPRKGREAGVVYLPPGVVPASAALMAMHVGEDESNMWPAIWPGDIIVIDSAPPCRADPDVDGIYALRLRGKGMVRRCRKIGGRLLIIGDRDEGADPEWVSLDTRRILDVVRGRIVWVSRRLDEEPGRSLA